MSPVMKKPKQQSNQQSVDGSMDMEAKDQYGIINKLKVAIQRKYDIVEMVGNGSYGTVMKAKNRLTEELVALKIMKSQPKMEYEIIKLLRELQLMRALNKLNVQFFGNNCFVPKILDIICPDSKQPVSRRSIGERLANQKKDYDLSQLCIVMEYIETDLDQLMKHQIDFTEHHLLKVIYNTLIAISFVHECNVMHRDIKPANILLDSKCHVKVCDFGLARSLPQSVTSVPDSMNTKKLRGNYRRAEAQSVDDHEDQLALVLLEDRPRRKTQKRYMSLHVGSRWYRAPEISIIEKQYDQASDMWSFGCILYELIMYLLHQKQDPKDFDTKFQDVRFLFQGDSCFPLSPQNKNKGEKTEKEDKKKAHVVSKHDQIKVILRNIGHQTDGNLSFISSENAAQYVKDLENASLKGETNAILLTQIEVFKKKLHKKELCFLLKNMLNFNPYFRMTTVEAYTSLSIFDGIRDKVKEAGLKKMREQTKNLIELDIDSMDAFDYEDATKAKYSVP